MTRVHGSRQVGAGRGPAHRPTRVRVVAAAVLTGVVAATALTAQPAQARPGTTSRPTPGTSRPAQVHGGGDATGALAAAATPGLLWAGTGSHTGGASLDGAAATSPLYVWVSDDGAIRSVAFSVDGRLVRTEAQAAYDLGGTAGNGAGLPYVLSAGQHRVSAAVTATSGGVSTLTATFTVASGPAPATPQLLWARSGSHTGGAALSGATAPTPLYVWVSDNGVTRSVAFSVDGRAARTEESAAYDLGGTAPNGSGLPYQLTAGAHRITAVVTSVSGTTANLGASFTVADATTPTPPTPTPTPPTPTGEPASACYIDAPGGNVSDGHSTDRTTFAPSTGTLRAVMLFVDFPDAPASAAPAGYTTTAPYSAFFSPSAPAWYRTASYGRLDLQITPVDRWYRMPRNADSYGYQRGLTGEQHAAYIGDAVRAADSTVDFSAYDLVYIVPPRNASAISFSPTFVWGQGSPVSADGRKIGVAVTFGQDMWYWGPKVLNHESGHAMGLPDLYAFTPVDGDQFPYTGGWDMMGDIAGHAPDYVGLEKWKLGWLTDGQVRCVTRPSTTTHVLTPLESTGGTKLLVVRTGTTTGYLVETRRALGNDTRACSTGALIYRVDTATASGSGPLRVVDSSPGGGTRSGCADLDIATWAAGSTFRDTAAGVSIHIDGDNGTDDNVTVTKS